MSAAVELATGEILSTSVQVPSAENINAAHRMARNCAENAVQYAIRCGELLLAKKAELKHGELMPWIRNNCDFKQATASRYIKAAQQNSTGVEISALSHLFTTGLPNDSEPDDYDDTEPHNHRAQGTGENEWYTPSKYVEVARSVMGGIDVDPASSAVANETVRAVRFFDASDDGLTQEWAGRVWLNPPYAQPHIQLFIEKLVAEVRAKRTKQAIALTHNYTDTVWFHIAARACNAICFTRGRVRFVSPEGEEAAPTQGQAFFYFGKKVESFCEAFAEFGFLVRVT